MGYPRCAQKSGTFLKILMAFLGVAVLGAIVHLSYPFKTHSITILKTKPSRGLSSSLIMDANSLEFHEGHVGAGGHSLLAEIPKKDLSKGEPALGENGMDEVVSKNDVPLIGLLTTHHKTGTVLFSDLFRTLCPLIGVDFQKVDGSVPLGNLTLGPTVRFLQAYNADQKIAMSQHGFKETCSKEYLCDRFDATCRLPACSLIDNGDESYGVVHVVRNPLEILISGYLYHRGMGSALVNRGSELWLLDDKSDLLPENMRERFTGVPYYKVLEQLSTIEGIKAEFFVNGAQIFQAARNYRDLKNRTGAMNIHFEDLQSDYKGTMQKVFKTINVSKKVPMLRLLEVASLYDIQTMPREMMPQEVGSHMTEGKFDKQTLREMIYDDQKLKTVLNHLAKEMDYDSAFPKSMKS